MVKVRLRGLLIILSYLCHISEGLHPPQCHWSLVNDLDRLNCLVQARTSLIVEEEVYGMGPEHAKSLWVECSPATPPEDSGFVLSHGVFMAVPNLRDLRLEACRIAGITPGALSYLPYLQNLTIRAHTSLSRPPAPLDVKPGVLRGLPQLQSLDLSTTSLSSLPSDFLCFLPALQHLNLSGSGLRDFRSIGILPTDPTNPTNTCGNRLRSVDLSGNHFTLLPPATFVAVNELEELRLDLNSITLAAERALLGLGSLAILSLAGNELTSLPPEFFKDNRGLREVYLQNNSLGVLAPGLFSGLEHLTVLDLSSNDLSSEWVTGDMFRGLIRLNVLSLAQNRITRIDAVLFRDLTSLQILSLENNRISDINEAAFLGMPHLHTLILSHNSLKALDGRICGGLNLLSYLALDNNKLETVEADAFKNCSNVEDLNLSGNQLKAVPIGISHLNALRTLDLGENQITQINSTSYQNLPNLYGLRLTGNRIRTVGKEAFSQLPSLKIVNLAENNLTGMEAGTFDNNPNLHAIRLDVNKIENITGLFRNVPNLLWLNISGNALTELDYAEFPSRLQLLNVQSNQISALATCLHVESLRIRTLDLSDNILTEIGSANLPDSIEKLILRRNRIHTVQPYTFFRKPNLTRVDLSSNHLAKLDQNALRLSPARDRPPVEILLGKNPLQCDCSMEWLQNIQQDGDGQGTTHYPVLLDAGDVKCSLSFERMAAAVEYMRVPASQFLCKYESHCFGSCHCCDYDACDCQMTCPTNCTCYHDQAWAVSVVDCSMLESNYIPARIPMDATQLYLDGNVLPSLDSHAFIGRKNLRALYLNGSHIEVIQNRSLTGLKQLRTLHLENNFIERLEGFEFDELDNLEELYLQQNSISWISNETFARLGKLRVLWLHGNNFVDLPIWSVTTEVGRLGSTLNEITLRGNEWSCECGFATQLRDWLLDYGAKVNDAAQVHCVDQVYNNNNRINRSGSSELVVVRLLDQRNHRCSSTTDLSILERPAQEEASSWGEYLPPVLSLTTVIILLGIMGCVAFYWRQPLKVWVHSKFGIRLHSCSEPMGERDKLFDAFVSYSSKDEAWVRQVLAAELERHDPAYRLCLRYRDLPTGGTYLADTIVQASEASRRTVLVLSQHFLKGEWSRSDVKSAHHSVLKDRQRKVIIVLLGDLPSKDLDPDIRLYLKNHTYLSCDDQRFWDKLRYALPDVKVKAGISRGHTMRSSSQSHSHYHTASPPDVPPPIPHTHPPPHPHSHPPPQYQPHPPQPQQRALVMSMGNGTTQTILSPGPPNHGPPNHGPPLPPLRHPPNLILNSANPNRHVAIHI